MVTSGVRQWTDDFGGGGDRIQFIASTFKKTVFLSLIFLLGFSDKEAEDSVLPLITKIELWTELELKHVSFWLPKHIVFLL